MKRKKQNVVTKRSYPKILLVIPTLKDNPTEAVESVQCQTVPVSKIIVVVGSRQLCNELANELAKCADIIFSKPSMKEPLGLRVAKALNIALSRVRIEEYDYILRVDADIRLPKKFIEENIKLDADIVGKAGYAMLIKNKTFLQIFKGQFPEVASEDSYINYKLWSLGKKVEDWKVYPKLLPQSVRKHFWRQKFHSGMEAYRIGYEPIHVVARLRSDPAKNVFFCLGYTCALLRCLRKYEFAAKVFKFQIKRAFSLADRH